MGKTKNRSRKLRGTYVLLAILTIAALGVSAFAILRPIPDAAGQEIPRSAVTETAIAGPDRVSISEAMSRLDDTGRPFTMVVLGDSTGAEADSWPTLVGQWVSETYDRPVTMNLWKEASEPAGYLPSRTLGDGANAPVALYNGSAAGRDAPYSLSKLGEMIPVDMSTIDLIIINHGHNHGSSELTPEVGSLALRLSQSAPQASLALILQNPEAGESNHVAIHDANTTSLELYAGRFSYETIDVRQAFLDYGDFASLYRDNVHIAGAEGFQLWADVVIAALSQQ